MQLYASVFHKNRDRTVLAVLIAASFALLSLPETTQLDFARTLLGRVMRPAQHAVDLIDDYSSVRAENERLRRLAEFKEEQTFRLVPAEVIGRDFDRIQTSLIIDKGAREGLRERMPVFSYDGLVGSLSHVEEQSAWVQLLSSKNHPVSCIDKRSRVVGVLEWRHRNNFELKHVSAVEDVAVGDTLLTSGFGGTIPKGFPVAIVVRAATATDGLSLRVDARSPVDFMSLEEVFVMTTPLPWDRSLFYDEADTLLMRDVLQRKRR